MRTVSDWLRQARDAGAVADAERCLDAAAALARRCHEWRTILAALYDLPAVAPQRVAGLAERTLESARRDGDVCGFCEVASLRVDVLDDEDGARQALQAGVETLHRRDSQAYEWAWLAEGFLDTLGDVSAARQCLDTGRAAALRRGDPDDLATIAAPLDRLGDRPAALAVVAEAEELLAADPDTDPYDAASAVWSMANAWDALGEHAASQRLLSEATQRARTTEAALSLARAWRTHGDEPGTDRALARAAELAVDAADWLEVAEVSRVTERGESAVRAALDRAAATVVDEVVRERIAAGYLRWLGDAATAERIGPRGVPPETLRVVRRSLPGWQASPAPLFEWLRARVTREVLARIAIANYGADEAENLAALLDIWTTGLVPRELPWIPHEVLALCRWSNGEDVDHVERAWCCTLLALDDEDLENVAAGLVDSCLALGAPATELAEQFLAWICRTVDADTADSADSDTVEPDGDADPPPAPGLFALLLLRAAQDPADPRVAIIVSTMLHQAELAPGPDRFYTGSVVAALWAELSTRILAPLRPTRRDVDHLLDVLAASPGQPPSD